jgi:hypothetical protein
MVVLQIGESKEGDGRSSDYYKVITDKEERRLNTNEELTMECSNCQA